MNMMHETEIKIERAILAGVHTGSGDVLLDTTEESIAELEELAKTAGVEVVGYLVQNRKSPDAATYIGDGKLEELKNAADELDADTIIFDDELSPVQVRNISDHLERKVIDRTSLILDIFAMRAATKEGKIQVELAQLRYMLPRLTGMGRALSRLGGGIGTRGPGETKLETDRRHIRRRIEFLSDELKEVEKHRGLLRARREKDNKTVVALVGYTNAGKSTLLNLLTDAQVIAEDKLFATLDPTQRSLTLSDNREILLVDTVGFIRKLPHHLVKAFKSTLEEAALADVLLHVIDASNDEFAAHIEVVERILSELGAGGKPTVAVLNKMDLAEGKILPHTIESCTKTVCISAKERTGIDALLDAVEEVVPGKKREVSLCIPYSEARLVSALHQDQVVLGEEYAETGIFVTALVDAACYNMVRRYVADRQV